MRRGHGCDAPTIVEKGHEGDVAVYAFVSGFCIEHIGASDGADHNRVDHGVTCIILDNNDRRLHLGCKITP